MKDHKFTRRNSISTIDNFLRTRRFTVTQDLHRKHCMTLRKLVNSAWVFWGNINFDELIEIANEMKGYNREVDNG